MPDQLLIRAYKTPVQLLQRDDTPAGSIGTLEAYVAVFNSDSLDLGGYIEQIKPGAFAESLGTQDVVALINHEHSVVVGRLSSGTLRLVEDEKGLLASIDLPDTQAGRDLKTLIERGDLWGCSFGFQIEDEEWSKRDGDDICTLTQISLHEVSVGVTWPAYPNTSMELRKQQIESRKKNENLRKREQARWEFKKNQRKCRR